MHNFRAIESGRPLWDRPHASRETGRYLDSACGSHKAARGATESDSGYALETITNDDILVCMVSEIGKVKHAVTGVKGAVHYLGGPVYSTNTQGKFDKLFGAISDLAA